MDCHKTGCQHLQTTCISCGRIVCEKILPKSEWISVKDMLPDDYEFVLVYSEMQGTNEPCPITIARWNSKKWETLCNEEENNACAKGDLFWSTNSEEITHWMPLPKPPAIEP